MKILGVTIDLLLGLGLLFVAWKSLSCRDLFNAVLLFVAFSLLMSLIWVRLDAPDIALAEATIGAGLTGAILLAALAQLNAHVRTENAVRPSARNGRKAILIRLSAILVMLPAATGLIYVVATFQSVAPGLGSEIAANLQRSGVGNPVTAVLLNFRGYDTFLEMLVLLLALLGVWSLGRPAQFASPERPGPVLSVLAKLSIPLLILVAGYMLLIGSSAPGGAFQAGAILGAGGVLLRMAGWRIGANFAQVWIRLVIIAGAAVFVGVAAISSMLLGEFLQYPAEYAGLVILVIEAAAAVSIGATLMALFLLGPPTQDEEPS